jgi:hypothetical protein
MIGAGAGCNEERVSAKGQDDRASPAEPAQGRRAAAPQGERCQHQRCAAIAQQREIERPEPSVGPGAREHEVGSPAQCGARAKSPAECLSRELEGTAHDGVLSAGQWVGILPALCAHRGRGTRSKHPGETRITGEFGRQRAGTRASSNFLALPPESARFRRFRPTDAHRPQVTKHFGLGAAHLYRPARFNPMDRGRAPAASKQCRIERRDLPLPVASVVE